MTNKEILSGFEEIWKKEIGPIKWSEKKEFFFANVYIKKINLTVIFCLYKKKNDTNDFKNQLFVYVDEDNKEKFDSKIHLWKGSDEGLYSVCHSGSSEDSVNTLHEYWRCVKNINLDKDSYGKNTHASMWFESNEKDPFCTSSNYFDLENNEGVVLDSDTRKLILSNNELEISYSNEKLFLSPKEKNEPYDSEMWEENKSKTIGLCFHNQIYNKKKKDAEDKYNLPKNKNILIIGTSYLGSHISKILGNKKLNNNIFLFEDDIKVTPVDLKKSIYSEIPKVIGEFASSDSYCNNQYTRAILIKKYLNTKSIKIQVLLELNDDEYDLIILASETTQKDQEKLNKYPDAEKIIIQPLNSSKLFATFIFEEYNLKKYHNAIDNSIIIKNWQAESTLKKNYRYVSCILNKILEQFEQNKKRRGYEVIEPKNNN